MDMNMTSIFDSHSIDTCRCATTVYSVTMLPIPEVRLLPRDGSLNGKQSDANVSSCVAREPINPMQHNRAQTKGNSLNP